MINQNCWLALRWWW